MGYSIDSRMKSRLAVAALGNAVARRYAAGADAAGSMLHTDRGSQFWSRKFVHALNPHTRVGSMGRVGPRRIRVDHDHNRQSGGLTEPVTRAQQTPGNGQVC